MWQVFTGLIAWAPWSSIAPCCYSGGSQSLVCTGIAKEAHLKYRFQGPTAEGFCFSSCRMGPGDLHFNRQSKRSWDRWSSGHTERLIEVRQVEGKFIETEECYLYFCLWIEWSKGLPLGSPKYFLGKIFYLLSCLDKYEEPKVYFLKHEKTVFLPSDV